MSRQSPNKTPRIKTTVLHTSGPKLVIFAWTGDELLRVVETHTHTGDDNNRRPKLAPGIEIKMLRY